MIRFAYIAFILLLGMPVWRLQAHEGGELRATLSHDPKTFDPALVEESSSETVRYLTGGVLMRLHRVTQKAEPELAQSWKLHGGRRLTLRLRKGLSFSDGTPFTAEDVAFTFRRLLDPALRSPTADAFRSGSGTVTVAIASPDELTITFPAPVATVERLLDQVAIQSAKSPQRDKAVLGPFLVAEHRAGSFLRLRRNPHYWKRDPKGRQLPYLDSIRFDIQSNRDLEALRLRRGELHLAEGLDADTYERLRTAPGLRVLDAGASTDVEMIWFNLSPQASIPPYKKEWFRSREFRRAISAAVNRADLVRIAYKGYAHAAAGPVPIWSVWSNKQVLPPSYDPSSIRKLLAEAGFHYSGAQLLDRAGNPVVFSLITNAGNKVRARIAALVQQDLQKIGIQLNVVPLDFPSLLERIGQTFEYEACLLGLVNVDPDPNGQMNVWLSSSRNHQWNPSQKAPATPWEAQIDELMRLQASTNHEQTRQNAFGKVQEILAREAPLLFLVNRHALAAVSGKLQNVVPSPLRPHVLWNAEYLRLADYPGGSDALIRSAR